jgi:hypothetical protein
MSIKRALGAKIQLLFYPPVHRIFRVKREEENNVPPNRE